MIGGHHFAHWRFLRLFSRAFWVLEAVVAKDWFRAAGAEGDLAMGTAAAASCFVESCCGGGRFFGAFASFAGAGFIALVVHKDLLVG